MIELYKPDMYQKDIYSIDYKKLKSYGIKCILFDLDNTLVAPYIKKPPRKLKDFIERIKDMKFKVIIYSNASKKRISPFKKTLEVDASYSSRKRHGKKLKKIISEYKYSESEISLIGDQFMTDVYGGNKEGIFTVLVDPISDRELIWTKFNRILEKGKIKKLERKKLFKKGVYYE